jgi:2OG-Fe(II) oxygenase superfamily
MAMVGPRLAICEDFYGLQRIHANPDIFIIRDFLQPDACRDLMQRAQQKTLDPSPVAYAGWTDDVKDLVELAVKGPVTWLAILGAWFQATKQDDSASSSSIVDLVVHMVQNFAILAILAVAGIATYTKSRADGLQQLRTSTSTTLDDLSDVNSGTAVFVRRTADLFDTTTSRSSSGSSVDKDDDDEKNQQQHLAQQEQQPQHPAAAAATRTAAARFFEAPTVIRYEAGQVLAPHYDANRSAQVEDANRGGQTLATLIVYLNDVQRGGLTRFGKLKKPSSAASSSSSLLSPSIAAADESVGKEDEETNKFALTIQPKMGDALLFFPADAAGTFDERTEHEGCPAVDEKWIARIWRHAHRVPPPFGLDEVNLARI